MLLVDGLGTFPIKGNPVFSNGPKSPTKNLPNCHILCKWLFDSFILAEELFAKALRSFQTCVLANNKLCEKLFSSLEPPTIFEEILKITLVPSFIPDLTC